MVVRGMATRSSRSMRIPSDVRTWPVAESIAMGVGVAGTEPPVTSDNSSTSRTDVFQNTVRDSVVHGRSPVTNSVTGPGA